MENEYWAMTLLNRIQSKSIAILIPPYILHLSIIISLILICWNSFYINS